MVGEGEGGGETEEKGAVVHLKELIKTEREQKVE